MKSGGADIMLVTLVH